MNDNAFNFLMKYEVGPWFNPNLEDTQQGKCGTVVEKKRTGFVNNPNDKGGMTKFGIAKKSHPNVDIVKMTMDDAKEIYEEDYWQAGGCDDMADDIAQFHFDTCVLHGVGTAKKLFDEDIEQYATNRLNRYDEIVAKDPSQRRFLAGWRNRVEDLLKELT